MKRLWLILPAMFSAMAHAQGPVGAVSPQERQHAAMMILVIVLLGLLGTILLLWFLRRRGLLKEEKPDSRLQQLQDEIARRSGEMRGH